MWLRRVRPCRASVNPSGRSGAARAALLSALRRSCYDFLHLYTSLSLTLTK